MQRKESKEPASISTYFIVLKPIVYQKKLDDAEASSILNKVMQLFPENSHVYVYTDKEQAKLAASEFSAREIPGMFNKNQHKLAKPILCISLDHSIELKDRDETRIFGRGVQKTLVSYKVSAAELQQWQNSEWSLLINENELSPRNIKQSDDAPREDKCSLI